MLSRILVADDSEAIQKAIRLAFQGFSVTIYEASSYVETLNTCKKCRPELIIVDASLTGTDGPGDFQNIMAISGRVPMILLEGSYEPIDREAFKNLGLNHLVKKPFGKDELLSILSRDFALSMAAGDASIQQETYDQEDFNQPEIPYQRTEESISEEDSRSLGNQDETAGSCEEQQAIGERDATPPPPPVPFQQEEATEPELPDDMFSNSPGGSESVTPPPPPPPPDELATTSASFIGTGPSDDFLDQAIDSTFAGILPHSSDDSSSSEQVSSRENGRGVEGDFVSMDTPETFSKEIFRTSAQDVQDGHSEDFGVRITKEGGAMSSEVDRSRVHQNQLSGASFVKEEYEEAIRIEVRKLVREAVDEYCKMFFKPLLKELVTEELRKLAQEQASHMTES